MTKTTKNRAVRTALVLGITLGSAGAMIAVSVPLTSYEAQAFGWSDITGAAKKVGNGIKDGAKTVGKAAVETHKAAKRAKTEIRDAARRATARTAGSILVNIGREGQRVFEKATGTHDPERFARERAKDGEFLDGYADFLTGYNGVKERIKGKIIDTGKDAARKVREKVMSGKLTPAPPRNQRFQPGQWGQNGNPLAQGLVNQPPKKRAPVQSITLERAKPGAGLTSQITLQKGKPAGRNTLPLAQKGTKAPVLGITRENLRPARGQRPNVTLQDRPVGKATTRTTPKGQARNVPGHQGTKTPQERKRIYPNYPPKRDYPNYPVKKVGGNLTKQGKAMNDRSAAGRPVGGNKPLGNDRSLAGRPVGGKKPIGQDRSMVRRPAGITKQNLQPRRKVLQFKQGKAKVTRDLSSKTFGGGGKTKTKHWSGKVRKKAVPMKMQGKRKSMKKGNGKRSLNNRSRQDRRG